MKSPTLKTLRAYFQTLRTLPRGVRELQDELRTLRSKLETVEREADGLRLLHETSAMQLLAADGSAVTPEVPSPRPPLLRSSICKAEHFDSEFYRYWCDRFREERVYHRKQWEWVFICQALLERDALKPGKRGLGFGVGREPLAALFASMRCSVLATDGEKDNAQRQGWDTTQQFASDRDILNERGLCPPELFAANVRYQTVDMTHVPADLQGFDFCWSACALEHLGSIEKGSQFVRRSVTCLKPGGIAVHTTEFNVFSNMDTRDNDAFAVIFRRKDLERLVDDLERDGYDVEPFDFEPGRRAIDTYIDPGPFYCPKSYGHGLPHLKLLLGGFVTTSIGLIIRRRS